MKIIAILFSVMLALPALATPPEVTNVRASQREGTKLIDLWYDVADADGDLLKVRIEVSDNNGAKWSIPAFTFTGDIGDGIAPGANKHVVWDAGIDWDGEYSDQMRIKVFAVDAKGYPGLEWGDEVLPGGFLLGQDGGVEGSGPSRHVNIPWSYWLSKYEITVGQYCDFLNTAWGAGKIGRSGQNEACSLEGTSLIDHLMDSYKLIDLGDSEQIRWNVNKFEVVGTKTNQPVAVTWYGAMAWANFYGYDLPTEAEWEKAARGPDFDDQGEHCLYTWGNDRSNDKANFYDNLTAVGSYAPNGYGCCDMTGNADGEWTRTIFYFYTTKKYYTSIDNYPLEENLSSLIHTYWESYYADGNEQKPYQMVVKDFVDGNGSFNSGHHYIYERAYEPFGSTSPGFRVCKRYIPEGN